MRPWARWTAKTALVAVGFAAAGGGLAGVAFAGPGEANSGGADSGGAATSGIPGNNQVTAPAGMPVTVCGVAGAMLGIVGADCQGGAQVVSGPPASAGPAAPGHRSAGSARGNLLADGRNSTIAYMAINHSAGELISDAAASAASALGSSAGPLAGLAPVSGLTYVAAVAGAGNSPDAGSASGRAGHAGFLAAPQLLGLGALPGLADLPSLGGLATVPALNGTSGTGIGTAPSASGMSSDSFAALAVGALLAGASAVKIAARRARDRKAGIGK